MLTPTGCSESVWCNIQFKTGQSLTVGSFYRSPANTSPESFTSLSEFISTINNDYLIGGDFNMPDVRWADNKPVLGNSSALSMAFLEAIVVNDIYQFVTQPTRCGHNSSSVLDLLFSNQPSLVSHNSVIPGISDHDCVVAHVQIVPFTCVHDRPRKIYYFDKGNYASLSNELAVFLQEFSHLAQSADCNTLWDTFCFTLKQLVDKHVPTKQLSAKKRSDKPWVNYSGSQANY